MNDFLLEICCGSAEDAIAAFAGGADRVELNSDLFHGGLTPTVGSLITVKKACPGKPVMCMVRPREGGFCYTDTEFAVMQEDARQLLAAGADGIVFGFLHEDGTVDEGRSSVLRSMIGSKTAVFHRAIDVTPDWHKGLEALIRLKIDRVLTSGQKPTVPEGIPTLKEMLSFADGKIEILPGGGIAPENIAWVRQELNARQLHAAIHRNAYDSSCNGNPAIYFGGAVYPREDRFLLTHAEDVRMLAQYGRK